MERSLPSSCSVGNHGVGGDRNRPRLTVRMNLPPLVFGEPEEVAAAVAFLCLPAAGYVTGECIAVLRYGF